MPRDNVPSDSYNLSFWSLSARLLELMLDCTSGRYEPRCRWQLRPAAILRSQSSHERLCLEKCLDSCRHNVTSSWLVTADTMSDSLPAITACSRQRVYSCLQPPTHVFQSAAPTLSWKVSRRLLKNASKETIDGWIPVRNRLWPVTGKVWTLVTSLYFVQHQRPANRILFLPNEACVDNRQWPSWWMLRLSRSLSRLWSQDMKTSAKGTGTCLHVGLMLNLKDLRHTF